MSSSNKRKFALADWMFKEKQTPAKNNKSNEVENSYPDFAASQKAVTKR